MTIKEEDTFFPTVGRSSESSSLPVSNSTGADARIPADNLKKQSSEVWRDKHLFLSFGVCTHQAHILVFPCTVDAARLLVPVIFLIKPSVSPNHSFNLKTVMALS